MHSLANTHTHAANLIPSHAGVLRIVMVGHELIGVQDRFVRLFEAVVGPAIVTYWPYSPYSPCSHSRIGWLWRKARAFRPPARLEYSSTHAQEQKIARCVLSVATLQVARCVLHECTLRVAGMHAACCTGCRPSGAREAPQMPTAQLEHLVAAAGLGSPRKVLAEMADCRLGLKQDGNDFAHLVLG